MLQAYIVHCIQTGQEEDLKKEVIKTNDAVGKILAHDITRIVKGEFKGSVFKKGHVIREEDVDTLLNVGKNNIYVLELSDNEIHEDEAGIRLGNAIKGNGIRTVPPAESRVNLFAERDGLLKVNKEAVNKINDLPYIVVSTLPDNMRVSEGQMIAGTKVIPLVVDASDVKAAEDAAAAAGWVLEVKPFQKKKVGCVITGSEVFYNRVPDAFAPVITEKVESYGSEILEITYAPDDLEVISEKIIDLKNKGAELIFTTGGMSVDPDDLTPSAIKHAGADIVTYGAPALPGAMFMMAYLDDIPIMGVPACGMFFRTTVVDLLLPKIFAGEKIEKSDINGFGVGGLCMQCDVCIWPKCTFGK
jgi:hypothetical protein